MKKIDKVAASIHQKIEKRKKISFTIFKKYESLANEKEIIQQVLYTNSIFIP